MYWCGQRAIRILEICKCEEGTDWALEEWIDAKLKNQMAFPTRQ